MVDYLEAIKRPFLELKKSGLAALLLWIPIANFLSYGYFLECAKTSLSKQRELPVWGSWADKFVKGFLFILIRVIYALPVFIIAFVFLGNVIRDIIFDESFLQAIQVGDSMAIYKIVNILLEPGVAGPFIFIIILGALISYLIPMAVIFYVINWKFKDAFNFKEILNRVLTKKYLKAWVIVSVYSAIVMSIGNFIPIVGGLIAGTLVGITSYTIFGSVYREIKV